MFCGRIPGPQVRRTGGTKPLYGHRRVTMITRTIISVVVLSAVLIQGLSGQRAPQLTRATKLVVEVSLESSSRHLHFSVDKRLVPNDDLLSYLTAHEKDYEDDAVPYVIVPSLLTIQEIGAIEGAMNKAGYHKIRFFLAATNRDFAVEIMFGAQVPLNSIWEN